MKDLITKTLAHVLNVLTPVRLIVLIIAGFFFWLLAFGDQGIYQLRRLLEMKNQFIGKRQNLNDEIDRITREKKVLTNPANLEMVIRKELGYIKPGEIIFEEKIIEEQLPPQERRRASVPRPSERSERTSIVPRERETP